LLDTHVLLWWLAGHSTIDSTARSAIAEPTSRVVASAASAWEIAVKRALGKLEAPGDLPAALSASRIESLPITVEHALAAGALPRHHDDPFDRMLIAQARVEGLTLVTRDRALSRYDVAVLPA